MSRANVRGSEAAILYHEESVKPVLLMLIVVVGLIALPLGWFIYNDMEQGTLSSDVSNYSVLAEELQIKAEAVQDMLKSEAVDETMLTQVSTAPKVTLITPDIAPTNVDKTASQDTGILDVKLKAIYWNPVDPLITIGDENYRVGEKINGFTIVEIRKTAVIFRSPLGEQVVKYFYDYLDKPKRN